MKFGMKERTKENDKKEKLSRILSSVADVACNADIFPRS